MKVKITEQELVRRINRKLALNVEGLEKSSGGQSHNATGDNYIIEFNHDKIITTNVDLENLGKELGVLRDFEELED
jgi:hypothetical protein